MQKLAAGPVRDHPLVTKLNDSIALDDGDLMALARLLERRIAVKKAKDIIVEGYKYRVLHIVERGGAYTPAHPFLVPAYEANKAGLVDLVDDELDDL